MKIKRHLSRVIVLFALSTVLIALVSLKSSLNSILSLNLSKNNFEINYEFKQFKESSLPIKGVKEFNEMTAAEALNVLRRQENYTGAIKNVPFGESNNWYLIKLDNHTLSKKEMVFYIDNPMLDEIDVFAVGNGLELFSKQGDHRSSPNNLKATPNFELKLLPNQSTEVLIRTKTLGSPNFPLLIFEKEKFARYKNAIFLIWGIFIGITILISAYNLVLYAGSKEYLYLIYVSYVVLFLIVLSVLHGFGWFIFPTGVMTFFSTNLIFLYYWLGICLTLFTYYFLNVQKVKKDKLRIVTRLAVISMGLLSVTSLFLKEYQSANVFFPLQSLIYVLCVAMVISKAFVNIRWTNFYILSWFPLLISAAFGSMLMLGHIEYSFWTRHSTMLGVLFEVMFISLALAQRLRMREEALFYANTHHLGTGLPNVNAINHLLSNKSLEDKTHTVLLVSIDKIRSNTFTATRKDYEQFYQEIGKNISTELKKDLMLLDVSEKQTGEDAFYYNDDTLMYIIQSNDDFLLSDTLSKLFIEDKDQTPHDGKLSYLDAFVIPLKAENIESSELDSYRAFLSSQTTNSNVKFFDKAARENYKKFKQTTDGIQRQLELRELGVVFKEVKGEFGEVDALLLPYVKGNYEDLSIKKFLDSTKLIGAEYLACNELLKSITQIIIDKRHGQNIVIQLDAFSSERLLGLFNNYIRRNTTSVNKCIYVLTPPSFLFCSKRFPILSQLKEYEVTLIMDITEPFYFQKHSFLLEEFDYFRVKELGEKAKLKPGKHFFVF